MNEEKKIGGLLSASTLKIIATVFMVFDNAFMRFPEMGSFWHLITRFVAPLFAYLMVDGFFHTRSREKYMGRLWIAAVLMQIGNIISSLLLGNYSIRDNIFLTLAVGFTIIYLLERSKSAETLPRVLYIICAVAIFAVSIYIDFHRIPFIFNSYIIMEGGLQLLPFIIFMYLFHNNKLLQSLSTIALSIFILFYFGGPEMLFYSGFDNFCFSSDWLVCLVVPFILLYNGQKGNSKLLGKYFFYVFYPLHLWIICIAAYFIKQ
ncbi:MAG: conjugal transfer protein TraX [Lachnospiraceae bacterium]|nr:conjugal transfer protein TraX [Lachnospiraceae bacterium]